MVDYIKNFFSILSLLVSPLLFAVEDASLFTMAPSLHKTEEEVLAPAKDGYTINYNTVSMVEYLRFASKICSINFIFDEADLGFTVSVVSDAPITPDNVMATLLQVLRIHGLSLLEQGNNLVIHQSPDVAQIATLVTEKGQEKRSPIVTRIFRTSNVKADSIAGIIRPMISRSALLEVLQETKQIILTDVTANVDKVAALIEILDSPHNQLSVRTYTALHNNPETLIDLCNRIMAPFAQGNPFLLVPQLAVNEIFIVSTADLIEQTLALLNNLDTPPKKEILSGAKLKGENIFVYKTLHRSGDEILSGLMNIAKNLQESGLPEGDLISVMKSAKAIPETHSITFVGSPQSLEKIKEFLLVIDVSGKGEGGTTIPLSNQFFIYKPVQQKGESLAKSIQEIAQDLKSDSFHDPAFLRTLESMKYVKATNSLLFTGDATSLKRLESLIGTLEARSDAPTKPTYYIYKLQAASGEIVEEDLQHLAKTLKTSEMKEDKVTAVIEKMRYVKETNSLLLTGDPTAIEEVKKLIAEYDYPRTEPEAPSSHFFLYKPHHQTAAQIEKSLRDLAANLKKAGLVDRSFLSTIDGMKYVETTNSLIFTGNPDAIQKIQSLLKDIDTPPKEHAPIQHIGQTTFLLYKLKAAGGSEIVSSIKTMTANLKAGKTADADFLAALNSMKYVKETNSLFFTGTETALAKVQGLVEQFDVSSLAPAAPAPEKPLQAGLSHFYLYKSITLPAADLEKLLNDFAGNLRSSGLTDPELFSAIHSMRYIVATQSLVFTGTPKALKQIEELVKAFDVPSNATGKIATSSADSPIQAIDNTSFLVYKLQFHKGDEIQGALKQISRDLLQTSTAVNQNLLNSINSVQWLNVTNSLLISGDQDTLTRLKELIKNLDIPLKQVFIEILVIETTLSNALLFGLEWGGNYNFNNRFGISSFNTTPGVNQQNPQFDQFIQKLSGLTPPAPPTPIGNIPPVSGFDLGVIGEVIKHNGNTFLTIGSLLTALQADTETSIITSTKLLGQDGHTSSIFSGSNIPFTGSFVNNTTTGATILTSNIEYRDIGVNLTITPVLGNSDIVTLDISLDRSQTATDITGQNQLNFQSQTANGIITSKTTMQTTVHVPDRNFLVLSGFVNNSNTKVNQGIPCLGGLPVIGAAFSQQNNTVSTQNIVIFLRPYITNSIDDMRRLTSDQENFFRDLAGTPFLEQSYNEAVELIKTIDDE